MQVVDITTNSRGETNVRRINVNEAAKDNQRVKITNKKQQILEKNNIAQQYIDI